MLRTELPGSNLFPLDVAGALTAGLSGDVIPLPAGPGYETDRRVGTATAS